MIASHKKLRYLIPLESTNFIQILTFGIYQTNEIKKYLEGKMDFCLKIYKLTQKRGVIAIIEYFDISHDNERDCRHQSNQNLLSQQVDCKDYFTQLFMIYKEAQFFDKLCQFRNKIILFFGKNKNKQRQEINNRIISRLNKSKIKHIKGYKVISQCLIWYIGFYEITSIQLTIYLQIQDFKSLKIFLPTKTLYKKEIKDLTQFKVEIDPNKSVTISNSNSQIELTDEIQTIIVFNDLITHTNSQNIKHMISFIQPQGLQYEYSNQVIIQYHQNSANKVESFLEYVREKANIPLRYISERKKLKRVCKTIFVYTKPEFLLILKSQKFDDQPFIIHLVSPKIKVVCDYHEIETFMDKIKENYSSQILNQYKLTKIGDNQYQINTPGENNSKELFIQLLFENFSRTSFIDQSTI